MKNIFVNFCAGLIDGHTHPVWAGDRVHEFAMKVSRYCSKREVAACTLSGCEISACQMAGQNGESSGMPNNIWMANRKGK